MTNFPAFILPPSNKIHPVLGGVHSIGTNNLFGTDGTLIYFLLSKFWLEKKIQSLGVQ